MFTANILLVCQTAEQIWIQLLLYQYTQGEASWADCFTLQLMFHCRKPATIKLHHSQTRGTWPGHPHPLRQEATKRTVHSPPPQGQQDTILAGITGLGLYCCLAHGKPVEGNKWETIKKEWTNQKWQQKKSKIFICERNVNWLTKTRKGCWSVNRPPSLPWLRLSCLSISSLIKGHLFMIFP